MNTRSVLGEVAAVYAGVTAVTFAITRLEAVPPFGDYVHLAVAAVFLVVALRLAQREEGGVERYGMGLGGLLLPPKDDRPAGPLGLFDLGRALGAAVPAAARETAVALGVLAVVLPPFIVGFYLWHRPAHSFRFDPSVAIFSVLLAHLVVVALPEEALFRGYFQTRLADAWPRTRRLLGVEVPLAALAGQAILFALMHFLVDLDARRLAVFFPALLFGWLRSWRKGIGAAIVVHAVSNVTIDILIRGWL